MSCSLKERALFHERKVLEYVASRLIACLLCRDLRKEGYETDKGHTQKE